MSSALLHDPGCRPDWDEYFLRLAELAATRSTCVRRQVGALLVSERRVLATGYNGAPKGLAHCHQTGCLRAELGIASGQRHEICRGIHAEQNAILQAAQHGVAVRGAVLYCTTQPCAICAKLLVNLDVPRLVIREGYPDELALQILAEAGYRSLKEERFSVWER